MDFWLLTQLEENALFFFFWKVEFLKKVEFWWLDGCVLATT